MKKIFKPVLLVILITICAKAASANMPDSTGPLVELYKLRAVFSEGTEVSFDCNYFIEDVDTVTTYDSMIGFVKFQNGSYWIKMDTIEQLQDQDFNLTVYPEQETMLLQSKMPLSDLLFQANVMDSLFFKSYTDSVIIRDSAGVRKLRCYFKDDMPYTRYEIVYDTATYHIQNIYCNIRKNLLVNVDLSGPITGYSVNLRVTYFNYRVEENSPSIFSTSRFIERKDGEYVPKSTYNTFHLANTINK